MLKATPFLLALFFVAASSPANAHAIAEASRTSDVLRLLETILIIAAVAMYARGVIRIRREVGADRVVSRSQTVAFGLAISLLVIILSPAVDAVTDALFSAHMAQHLVLMLFIPPLLVWSRPVLVSVWALPRPWRKAVAAAGVMRWIRSAVYGLMQPLVVAVLFLGAFSFWHLPRPYAWALSNAWLHAGEHLSFLITAIMFWTLVIEPSGKRRMGYIPTMLFVAVIAVLSGLPGALMLLSPVTLFKAHADAALSWGLTPLEDQQIAGVIMWVPAGIFFLVPIAWLFLKSLQLAGHQRVAGQGVSFLLVATCLLPFVESGCSQVESSGNASGQSHEQAKALIGKYGCGLCHTIPGVENARGRVGPSLAGIGDRVFIAGMLQNNSANMARWIINPQAVVPGNAMPATGIRPAEARTVAAYLATLHGQ